MRNIKFDTVTKTFECDNGIEIKFNLPMEGVDVESINFDEYKVELLINPLLDKEINAFALCKKTDKGRDTIGAVFNKDALNSTQKFRPYIAECILVAFKDCLEKQELQSEEVELSSFYENNISICVINKKRAGNDNPLHLCIHSLREYGYSYFEEDNKFKVPEGYDASLYIKQDQTNINVEFIEPSLYSNGMVDTIIRHLPYANNIAYRFILLYQIIELLMENAGYQLIKDSAEKYISRKISTNDFTESVKSVNVERDKIAKMFDMCIVKSEHGCNFCTECRHLFRISGCDPDKSSCLPDVFYSFRNLLTHSYRKVHAYPQELALVIQRFELVVLDIVKTYPNIVE